MAAPELDLALKNWTALNIWLKGADLSECLILLDFERNHAARREFLLRIHARMNRLRRGMERKALSEHARTQRVERKAKKRRA